MSLPPQASALPLCGIAQPGLYVFIASGGCNILFRLGYVYLSPLAVDYIKKHDAIVGRVALFATRQPTKQYAACQLELFASRQNGTID
jgi:hypothetical protein